jgi:hypothetical protein
MDPESGQIEGGCLIARLVPRSRYTLDATPYESLHVMFYTTLRGKGVLLKQPVFLEQIEISIEKVWKLPLVFATENADRFAFVWRDAGQGTAKAVDHPERVPNECDC